MGPRVKIWTFSCLLSRHRLLVVSECKRKSFRLLQCLPHEDVILPVSCVLSAQHNRKTQIVASGKSELRPASRRMRHALCLCTMTVTSLGDTSRKHAMLPGYVSRVPTAADQQNSMIFPGFQSFSQVVFFVFLCSLCVPFFQINKVT